MLLNPEMVHDMADKGGGIIIWQDFTKLGKVSGKELNNFTDMISGMLRLRPTMSAAFVTAPILISEKISNNIRDEMRRFEDKFDAKHLANYMVTLRMELPPQAKKVPIIFQGWLLIDQSTESDNIFACSQLVQDRSLSEFQETAQYLSGLSFPEAILASLTAKAKLSSKQLCIINCTTYDCWLERACMKSDTLPGFEMKTLSFSKQAGAWKSGKHGMGNVRPYEPHMVDSMDDVKLSDFKFKLLSVELVDGTKNKFNQKYSITLPPQIRSRFSTIDVVSAESDPPDEKVVEDAKKLSKAKGKEEKTEKTKEKNDKAANADDHKKEVREGTIQKDGLQQKEANEPKNGKKGDEEVAEVHPEMTKSQNEKTPKEPEPEKSRVAKALFHEEPEPEKKRSTKALTHEAPKKKTAPKRAKGADKETEEVEVTEEEEDEEMEEATEVPKKEPKKEKKEKKEAKDSEPAKGRMGKNEDRKRKDKKDSKKCKKVEELKEEEEEEEEEDKLQEEEAEEEEGGADAHDENDTEEDEKDDDDKEDEDSEKQKRRKCPKNQSKEGGAKKRKGALKDEEEEQKEQVSKRAKQGHKEVKGKRKHEEQPEGRKLSIAARALGLHESLGTPGSKQSAKSRKAKAKSSKAKKGEEEDEDSLDSDEEKEKPMWRTHPDRLKSIEKMTPSQLSRRRLKVKVSAEQEDADD
ncbi:unnamed protein product [Durusdinium trenchii]|uniref:FACT complex subunit n=1 Tax=Durusdinium trenchii TaxID=1381693 RepID=A0ABP0PZG5_9DINO